MATNMKATWAALLTLLAVSALLALGSGCAPGITTAYQVVAQTANVHKRGAELFDAFDKAQQEKILKAAKDRKDPDGGEAALKAYFAKQTLVLFALDKASGTILAAEASLPLIKLGIEKQKSPATWIAALLGQTAAIVEALTALGVPGLDALAKGAKSMWVAIVKGLVDIGVEIYTAIAGASEEEQQHAYEFMQGKIADMRSYGADLKLRIHQRNLESLAKARQQAADLADDEG